jgi:hypothetical protein
MHRKHLYAVLVNHSVCKALRVHSCAAFWYNPRHLKRSLGRMTHMCTFSQVATSPKLQFGGSQIMRIDNTVNMFVVLLSGETALSKMIEGRWKYDWQY